MSSPARRAVRLERLTFAICLLWLAGYWAWAHRAGAAWVMEDDALRINLIQYLLLDGGGWPHELGYGWLPLPTLWGALWAKVLGPPTAGAISAGNLAAMAGALVLVRALARRLAPGQPLAAAVVTVAFAFSAMALRLAASALSEPLVLLLALAAGLAFATAFALKGGTGVPPVIKGPQETPRSHQLALTSGFSALILSQLVRYEAWAATLLCGAAVVLLAWRTPSLRARAVLGFVALCVVPAVSSAASWHFRGDPLAYINDFRAVHFKYHANLTVPQRLARLAPGYPLAAAGLHSLSLLGCGMALARSSRRALPLAAFALATYGFLLLSAMRGEYAHVDQARFVAVPLLLLLPLAAVPVEEALRRLPPRRGRIVVWGVALASILAFAAAPKGYRLTRMELRQNILETVREAEAHTVLHLIPYGEEDVLAGSLTAFHPATRIVSLRVPADAAWPEVERLLQENPANVALWDGRLRTPVPADAPWRVVWMDEHRVLVPR